ncbi:MAG TPA: protein kinase [Gaiellaceae bacterium]|nr:protein kinase [Gaiellaceae bacterium]
MVGELIAGRYELEQLVGSGGMSNVFRAHDRLLERTVALKILHEQYTRDDDYVERFRREARAVAKLAHPNIVTVIDRGEQDGRQFIVFEYVDGPNLKDLTRDGPLEVHEAIGLTLQVAHALSFAHERGLVHRDVKPQNVLLNEDGQAKVTDFGIARSLDMQGVTQTGTVLGTSDYIAPEQARGQRVDPKTDIYSLGAVLYELLVGDVPFSGDNFVAVAMRHLNEPVPSVLEHRPDCPPRLDFAIQRAMAKDPDDRFASMDDFVAELEACRTEVDGRGDEGATMIVPPARRGPRRAERRSRRFPVTPLLVLLAGAAVAAGAYLLLRDDGSLPLVPNEAVSGPVRLQALGAYDPPPGDGSEHGEDAPRATDRNSGTAWGTETYRNFQKDGVGLVLRAPNPVALSRLTVQSIGSEFDAQIKAGNSPTGGFTDVSGDFQPVGSTKTFSVDTGGQKYRYYVVWLKLPFEGGQAEIAEVTART